MMRMAKIADDAGGADAGAPAEGGDAPKSGPAEATGASPLGSAGRWLSRLGRLEPALAGVSVALGAGSADRTPTGSACSAPEMEGFERRRGIGGGWLSGGTERPALATCDPAGSTGVLVGVAAPGAYEMVGAMGAFNALDDDARSGTSPSGLGDGILEAIPESRFGLGGGASLRDNGGAESDCEGSATSSTPVLAGSAGCAAISRAVSTPGTGGNEG